jgi:hypothetical protein
MVHLGFVAIGGTDSHDQNVGLYPTVFPDGFNTMSDLVDSVLPQPGMESWPC